MTLPPILFRCDAGVSLGTGHIMRCLALAQACADEGGQAAFLTMPGAPALEARLVSEGIVVIPQSENAGSKADAEETVRAARAIGAEWVVADGYHFGAEYQQRIKDAGVSLLLLDDYGHAEYYSADIVLNQNLSAAEGLYARRPLQTRLLLGPHYALLRREFRAWYGWKRAVPEQASKLLVTLGGSDPDNLTQKVIETLPEISTGALEAVVIVGGSNPHQQALEDAARRSPVSVRLEAAPSEMAKWMAWADAAVSAGGSTCWELALLGLPTLLIVLAENQRLGAEELERQGIMRVLKTIEGPIAEQEIAALLQSPEERARLSARGQALVDGLGSRRVLSSMQIGSTQRRRVRLKHAGAEDCKQFWEWANDTSVRAASFTSALIPWEEHGRWFEQRLRDPNTLLLAALDSEERPLGQVRFQSNGTDAEISISIEGQQRGHGYGQELLSEALREFFAAHPAHTVHAWIKTENIASQRLFAQAGFQRMPDGLRQGGTALHYIYPRQAMTS